MSSPRRLLPIVCIATLFLAVVYIFAGPGDEHRSWRDKSGHENVGGVIDPAGSAGVASPTASTRQSEDVVGEEEWRHLGTAQDAAVSKYTRVMVVPKIKKEDTSWIQQELPELETAIYVADDPSAALHPPRNKGHEVMIYLSYIIDHYDRLPDMVLFMHAHRWSYHNNDLQGADAVQMIKTLNENRVIREGYMNLRCHWDPGCPGHLHPLSAAPHPDEPHVYQLQSIVAAQWPKLFPEDPLPESLSQPCCAQFAVSRERIRATTLERYIFYRDWLLHTPLTDYYSGRIWEYLWQFIFTGQTVLCPVEHVCYCEGFGICFDGPDAYADWIALRDRRQQAARELDQWIERKNSPITAITTIEDQDDEPEEGRDVLLRDQIAALDREMDVRKAAAVRRGKELRNRVASSEAASAAGQAVG